MTVRIIFTTLVSFGMAHAQSIWDTLWIYRFEGSGTDKIMGVISDGQGHIVGAGYTDSYSSNYDILIVKLDSSGNLIWSKAISGPGDYDDYAYSIALDSSGYYVVAGYTRSFSNGADNDGWILKVDPETGDTVWTAVVGTPSNDYLNDILVLPDGNYLAAGYTYNTSSGYAGLLLVKMTPNGDTLWSITYTDATHYLKIVSIDIDEVGNIIAAGSAVSEDYTESYGFVMKMDSMGNLIWTKYVDTGGFDTFKDIIVDADGNYVAVGYSEDAYGYFDVWIVGMDSSNRNLLWSRKGGGPDDEFAYSIFQTPSGNYVVGGYTLSYGVQTTGLYLLRVDGSGNIIDSAIFDLSPSSDVIYASHIAPQGRFLFAGYTNGQDAFILKMRGESSTSIKEKSLPIRIQYTRGGLIVYSRKESNVRIYTTSGKLIRDITIAGKEHINLKKGIYILKASVESIGVTIPIVVR